MKGRACLVVPDDPVNHRRLLAARHRALINRGWEAHVLTEDAGALNLRLLRLRPDLVHFDSVASCEKAMRLRGLLNCRVVVSFRTDGRDLDHPSLEALFQEADLLLFPDVTLRNRAIAQVGSPEKAEVLPPPLQSREPAIAGNGRAPGSLRLFSAGPLRWEQGFEYAVHAVRLLLDRGIRCRYRIIGEGEDLHPVAFARHQLGLAETVELVPANGGHTLDEELRAADALVDPAVTDTAPAAPLAMAHALGIPFVATHRAGVPDDGGIRVGRRNPSEIADALASLAADPALRRQMGQAGRTGLAGYPTLEDHSLRLEGLYGRLLDQA